MRRTTWLLAALVLAGASFTAFADVYNVAATMPAVSGAAQCKLYMGATALPLKPCGSEQSYGGVIPVEGTYTFSYSGVSSGGIEGARGLTVSVTIDKTPGTPGPPTITITCRDASGTSVPCPSDIRILVQ